jgi:simple sugar transport system permease protein
MLSSKKIFELSRTVLAILIALFIALIAIFLVSDNPLSALNTFLFGPLKSLRHFGNVLEMMIPLIFTGLAVSIMFSSAQFNLGAEGAFFLGGIASTYIAVKWTMPLVVHPLIAILAGGLVGALFCGIPALLKVKWNASELVSSLMFNYVALFSGLYIINYYLRDVNAGAMVSYKLAESSKLVKLIPGTRVHFGLIIAVLAIFITYYFMFRTRWGYKIRLTGLNSSFSRYSGIKTASVVIMSQLLGGFVAGVGGSIELLGMYRRFSWQSLPGYGWDGIIVAILARNNPSLIPVGAFFLAYLRIGADLMARTSDVQSEVVYIIQGVMIVLIAAESFLAQYRHKMVFKEARKTVGSEG